MDNNQKLGTQATMVMAGFTALLILPVQIASAVMFTLMDGNAKADYVQTGFNSWTANGVNQLTKTATYVKIEGLEDCAPAESNGYFLLETSSCFQNGLVSLLDSNFNGFNDEAKVFYNYKDQFAITFTYKLTGGGTNDFISSLIQKVEIENKAGKRAFDIIQYYNLKLDDTFGDTAFIDPQTAITRQISNSLPIRTASSAVPSTLLGTITTEGSTPINSYQVSQAPSSNLYALNNSFEPVTGNPAIAYKFSQILDPQTSTQISQQISLNNTRFFNAPRLLVSQARFSNNTTLAPRAANDGIGVASEIPESRGLLGFMSLLALPLGQGLWKKLGQHLTKQQA